jgi:hypothetical protein
MNDLYNRCLISAIVQSRYASSNLLYEIIIEHDRNRSSQRNKIFKTPKNPRLDYVLYESNPILFDEIRFRATFPLHGPVLAGYINETEKGQE